MKTLQLISLRLQIKRCFTKTSCLFKEINGVFDNWNGPLVGQLLCFLDFKKIRLP